MSDASDEAELLDLLCLTMVPGVGPSTFQALMEQFGSAGKVLSASEGRLKGVSGVGPKLAKGISSARQDFNPEVERELCRKMGVEIVGRGWEGYPEPLERIPDPPPLLYRKGTITPGDELAVAIVGSRKCTPYGLRTAERLAQSLARVGLTVVSGLARGIDASAHRGALKAGGRTLAVLANGLAEIYPPEHEELAEQVAGSGAVVSEMPMRQPPMSDLFPRRNRIISGLCLGVVVVEATPKSGSLVTARHAMEQNREVFAVPGPVDSLPSRGCHALIRDGAKLVETVDDIMDEIRHAVRQVKPVYDPAPPIPKDRNPAELVLSEQERMILGHLDDAPKGVDEIIGRTRQTASQVMATLSVLEMRRLIRRMPGNLFVRL